MQQDQMNTANNKVKMGLRDNFKTFTKNSKGLLSDLTQNKTDIGNDDTMAEKAFIAFIRDILNDLKRTFINRELNKELQINEKLTKESIEKLLQSELENNQFLSSESKEKISGFLDTEYGSKFSTEIIGSKIIEINDFVEQQQKNGIQSAEIAKKLEDSSFDINPKDIQKMTAGKDEVVKDVSKKTITRKML